MVSSGSLASGVSIHPSFTDFSIPFRDTLLSPFRSCKAFLLGLIREMSIVSFLAVFIANSFVFALLSASTDTFSLEDGFTSLALVIVKNCAVAIKGRNATAKSIRIVCCAFPFQEGVTDNFVTYKRSQPQN